MTPEQQEAHMAAMEAGREDAYELTPEAAKWEQFGWNMSTAEYASSHGRPNELLEEEREDELELEEWLPDDVWGLDYV